MRLRMLLLFTMLVASVSAAESPVACTADPPVVDVNASTILRAWTAQPATSEVTWKSRTGEVLGMGSEISWKPSGKLDTESVSAEIKAGDTTSLSCQVIVIVNLPTRPFRTSGYALLKTGTHEESGFGLYSYLLFGDEPEAGARELCHSVASSFLAAVPMLSRFAQYVQDRKLPRTRINASFIPTTLDMPSGKASSSADERAVWILQAGNYDFTRARLYLDSLGGPRRRGVWLVSSLRPLMKSDAVPSPLLTIDVTHIPPELAGAWVNHYFDLAAQERFWDDKLTLDSLALKAVTVLTGLSKDAEAIRKSLPDWVKVLDLKGSSAHPGKAE